MPFDFAALESTYSEAAASQTDADPTKRPSGKQEAKVVKFKFAKDKNNDNYMKIHLQIDAGEFSGHHVWNNQRMKTKQNMEWFRKNLRTCGITPPATLKEYNADDDGNSALLDAAIGRRVQISIKARGDNDDIFFDKLLSEAAPAAPAPVDPKNAEIPF